jgi:hypothetical protein
MALTTLSNDQGYLKCGLLGYAKSGKTFTATKLAIGVKKFFNHPGPVAFFDTESGSNYVSEMVKKETGQDLVGVRARSFKDLMTFAHDCIDAKVSVAIIDSISHPWAELTESYLIQLNNKRRERNFAPLQRLEFQNWSAIKSMWAEWPTFFLNSPLHVIVCGRAAAIWEMEKDVETGRKELIKSGVKMKVETEFSFESSLLVEMEREQIPDGQGGFKISHQATVLGDRFGVLDGATITNPDFEFFLPHVKRLKPGLHAPVNTATKTETGADLEGSGDWQREQKSRTILCEEIQGVIVSVIPGQSAEDKKRKADLLQKVFGTRSWTAIESMQSASLRQAMPALMSELGIKVAEKAPDVVQGQPEAPDQCLELRQLLTKEKIRESVLLETLAGIGSIPENMKSLEEAVAKKPDIIKLTLGCWEDLSKQIKETHGANA